MPEARPKHRAGFARFLGTGKSDMMGKRIEVTALSCSTSVGIAISDSRCARSGKELLKLADEAMYEAKSAGKDRVHIA